jgi:hypothetical protein
MPNTETNPVWLRVIKAYKRAGGSGLSAPALVHLTGIPWRKLRKEIVSWYKKHHDLYIYHCRYIKADLITDAGYSPYPLEIRRLDRWAKKRNFHGVHEGEGEKELTVHGGEKVLDTLKLVVKQYEQEKAKSAK